MSIQDRVVSRWKSALKKEADFSVGQTVETEHWRVHRYADSVHATELTFAGKRGKKVPTLVAGVSGARQATPLESFAMEVLMWAKRGAGFARMKQVFDELQEAMGDSVYIHITQARGVDVLPAGFSPIEVKGKHVSINVSLREFSVKNLDDTANEPTCIPAMSGDMKAIPVFFRWVKDNESQISNMTYREVLDQMHQLGIKGHEYCAMD